MKAEGESQDGSIVDRGPQKGEEEKMDLGSKLHFTLYDKDELLRVIHKKVAIPNAPAGRQGMEMAECRFN